MTDELIILMDELKAAIHLPEELQSADRDNRIHGRFLCRCRQLVSKLCFCSLICLPGRITGTFGGQKRVARKINRKIAALVIFQQSSMRSWEHRLSRLAETII
ncbi:MAG: hypothetical protein ACREC9_10685 [Methylocella sp.]